MAGYCWILVRFSNNTLRIVCWYHLNPPKLPEGGFCWAGNCPECSINQPFPAITGPVGSEWVDLVGSWLDMGGTHQGRSDGTIWIPWNCHRGALGGLKWFQIRHKSNILAISNPGGSKWLYLVASWLDLVRADSRGSVGIITTHQSCHNGSLGVNIGLKTMIWLQIWYFRANFDPPTPPYGNFCWSELYQQTIPGVSSLDPTKI